MVGSRITAKGQTTIPKKIRDALGLRPGDRVLFVRKGSDVVVRPLVSTLHDLRGSVPPQRRPEDFDRVRAEVRRERAPRRR
jgi:AbrB family looped-hinge helix DNA binding protein